MVSYHVRCAVELSGLTPTPVKPTGAVSWLVVALQVLRRLTESVVHGQRAGLSAATERGAPSLKVPGLKAHLITVMPPCMYLTH